jgi:hypothetical protein
VVINRLGEDITVPSNQGRDLSAVLEDIAMPDLQQAAQVTWAAVHQHDARASCECPTLEGLARLYELGYRLVGPGNGEPSTVTHPGA